MIPEKTQKCSYGGCEDAPTVLACGRAYYNFNSGRCDGGHPVPAWYCERHALIVVDEGSPEYTHICPCCGCESGVN